MNRCISDETKLDFTSLRFCGREVELRKLHALYKSAKDESKELGSIVGFVSGYSGTGKTTLVQRGLRDPVCQDGGFFCSGKFDQLLSTRPYSGIVDAFTDLCSQLDRDEHGARVRKALPDRQDIDILINVLPAFGHVMDQNQESKEKENGNTQKQLANRETNREWGFERLKSLFRSLLGCLSSHERPIVFFLDDLQWADMGSLRIFYDLANEFHANSFVLVGAFRDNEVHHDHPLTTTVLNGLKQQDVTNLHVSDLSVDEVVEVVSCITHLIEAEALPLAEIVHRKTNGNVFFVIQFMKLLETESLLRYSLNDFKWKWDESRIMGEMNISDNVMDIVSGRLHGLSEQVRYLLQIGACMGRRLDTDALVFILSECHGKVFQRRPSRDLIVALLREAEQVGLIQPYAESKYKFSHDRIQQGAYALIDDEKERHRLHMIIGQQLYELSKTQQGEDWMFLLAVDQLVRGSCMIENQDDLANIAMLSLEAAQHVAAKSAFFPAADYLCAGIALLGDDGWDRHYKLCLALHSFAAEMEYCCGHFDICEELVNVVIAKGRSLDCKFPVYFVLVDKLSVQKRHKEAIDVAREVVRMAGERWPKNISIVSILWEASKMKRRLARMSEADLRSLPEMTNEITKSVLKIMAKAFTSAWLCNDMLSVMFLCVKMMKITVKKGLSEHSCVAFAHYIMIIILINKDLKKALRFAELSMEMMEKFDAFEHETRIASTLQSSTYHLQEPLTTGLDRFLHAYQSGFKTGDMDYCFIGAGQYIVAYFLCGLPLHVLERDAKGYAQQMVEYNQMNFSFFVAAYRQCALNLMGLSKNPVVLQGEALAGISEDIMTNERHAQVAYLVQLMLGIFFRDLVVVRTNVECLTRNGDVDYPAFWYTMQLFYRAVGWYMLARNTGARSDISHALKDTRKMEGWMKRGVSSAHHLLVFLEAERVALKGNELDTVESYNKAIRISSRSGYKQNEALANERVGQFLLDRRNAEQAGHYLQQAHFLYDTWGAKAKSRKLCREYEFLDSFSGDISDKNAGTNFKGKPKFSVKLADKQKNRDLVELGTSDMMDEVDELNPVNLKSWNARFAL